MTATRLNVLDEFYLQLDRASEPWSVHIEARVEGRIDTARLLDAVHEAARRHPLARARLRPARATDTRYHWEICEELGEVDLEVVARGALGEARERLLGRTPSLARPGPFALLLAHERGGDVLLLNLHHAAGDGLSALRLLVSIARAYAGQDDPLPPLDPLAERELAAICGGSLGQRAARAGAAFGYLTRALSMPTRVAGRGGSARPGYGFVLEQLEKRDLARISALRPEGATVNDVLLGALAVTIRRWNESQGAAGGWVYLTMPVNLRPAQWRSEVIGNYASCVSVRFSREQQRSLERAAAAAAAGTRRVKDAGLGGLLIDLFDPARGLPVGLKRRLQDVIPLTGNLAVDSATLSNLGRVEALPAFGDAGHVRGLWFSPPGRMPLGASLGADTLDGRLFLTLRYAHALLDAEAAQRFMATFTELLRCPPRRRVRRPSAAQKKGRPANRPGAPRSRSLA